MGFFEDVANTALDVVIPGRASNRANREAARDQMAFQERMRSTEYQTAVRDMKLAGINPMLAFSQGGASSPGGASAHMQDEVGPAISTALQARRLVAELKGMEAQRGLTQAQADSTAADTLLKLATGEEIIPPGQHLSRHLLSVQLRQAQLRSLRAATALNAAALPAAQVEGSRLAGQIRVGGQLFSSAGRLAAIAKKKGTPPPVGRRNR